MDLPACIRLGSIGLIVARVKEFMPVDPFFGIFRWKRVREDRAEMAMKIKKINAGVLCFLNGSLDKKLAIFAVVHL
ncbi:MAG: hypothetical protein HQM00_03155 [Magnetococcales bacterium]|nr:hypothetical protein [Magnetococcales bacterium]